MTTIHYNEYMVSKKLSTYLVPLLANIVGKVERSTSDDLDSQLPSSVQRESFLIEMENHKLCHLQFSVHTHSNCQIVP